MDCDDALLRVYEYLDGELTVWRRRAITRHLDECPPCADGFVFELELRRIVVSKCREEAPTRSGARSPRRSGSCRPTPWHSTTRLPDRRRTFYDGATASRGGTLRARPSEIMLLAAGCGGRAGRDRGSAST